MKDRFEIVEKPLRFIHLDRSNELNKDVTRMFTSNDSNSSSIGIELLDKTIIFFSVISIFDFVKENKKEGVL